MSNLRIICPVTRELCASPTYCEKGLERQGGADNLAVEGLPQKLANAMMTLHCALEKMDIAAEVAGDETENPEGRALAVQYRVMLATRRQQTP
jgi:hypothetical protein